MTERVSTWAIIATLLVSWFVVAILVAIGLGRLLRPYRLPYDPHGAGL